MDWHRGSNAEFSQTRWSVVLAARDHESADSRQALESLCESYRPPVYAFLRRRGYTSHDADDLAQSFFAGLLAKAFLANVSPNKGTFRSFILTSLKNFLINDWERNAALKRGGGKEPVPLDGIDIVDSDSSSQHSATASFDQAWATTLVQTAFTRLQDECRHSGKQAMFEELQRHLLHGEEPAGVAEIGARLGLSADTIRQVRHRLRHRFRELLKAVVAETVSDPAEIELEARYLVAVCGNCR